jgi:hypothetical protein
VAEHLVSEKTATSRDWTEAHRAAVVDEMNHVLANPTFKSSKRCVALLRYLVDHALAEEEDGTKERTLGIEVFGRDANYDTNADPIVRRTANEIRKRLAQYYQESTLDHAVKIRLVAGSYLPEFDFVSENLSWEPIKEKLPEKSPEPFTLHRNDGVQSEKRKNFFRRNWLLAIAGALLIVISGLLLIRLDAFRSPEYWVWKPLLDSGGRITVCLSDLTPLGSGQGNVSTQAASSDAPPALISHGSPQDASFADVHVAHEISTQLLGFKKETSLQPSSALTFQDFRQRPTVLIGGANNPWALILLKGLRYTVQIDPKTQDKWIQDAQNPSTRNWKIDGKLQSTDTFDDYAVVTRFFYKETGQWILALSGLEAHGTEAAGELVADPAFAKFIPTSVRPHGNFQIVLRASVIRGSTGPLEILAVHTW